MVAAIFAAEGWTVAVTPESKDGGKDVIAVRDGDSPEIVYIQAKMYRAGLGVGLPKVKEFAATLAGDGIRRGYIATTSHVTKDAREWLESNGRKLTVVDILEPRELGSRLQRLCGGRASAFML